VETLLELETLDRDTFEALMNKAPLPGRNGQAEPEEVATAVPALPAFAD
jgi:hypothetical protein